jgi:hypothetical protein
MSVYLRLLRLVMVALLVAGCRSGPSGGDAPQNQPSPTSVAQAAEMKKAGVVWTNGDIRAFYLRTVATIGPSNERWKQENVPAEERARRAFQVRHDARMTARAMMKDPAEVKLLQKRDQEKYGSPDGPSFDSLVARQKAKGVTGDAVYEAIVASAQHTDGAVNEMFGL